MSVLATTTTSKPTIALCRHTANYRSMSPHRQPPLTQIDEEFGSYSGYYKKHDFLKFIKIEDKNNGERKVFDLQEAIRQVKREESA